MGTLIVGSAPTEAAGLGNSYYGGTFIDNGTASNDSTGAVILASPNALGTYGINFNYNVPLLSPDLADLTVDGFGKLDLNGNSITVTSLNSSYSSGAVNGEITDNESVGNGAATSTLTVNVGGTSGLFAGTITDHGMGSGYPTVSLSVSTPWFGYNAVWRGPALDGNRRYLLLRRNDILRHLTNWGWNYQWPNLRVRRQPALPEQL